MFRDYNHKIINGAFDDKYAESKSNGSENISIEQHLEKFRPYLVEMINKFKKSDECKFN